MTANGNGGRCVQISNKARVLLLRRSCAHSIFDTDQPIAIPALPLLHFNVQQPDPQFMGSHSDDVWEKDLHLDCFCFIRKGEIEGE